MQGYRRQGLGPEAALERVRNQFSGVSLMAAIQPVRLRAISAWYDLVVVVVFSWAFSRY